MSDTDNALHHDYSLRELQFSDYYRPSSSQKTGELVYVGGGMLALGYLASRFL